MNNSIVHFVPVRSRHATLIERKAKKQRSKQQTRREHNSIHRYRAAHATRIYRIKLFAVCVPFTTEFGSFENKYNFQLHSYVCVVCVCVCAQTNNRFIHFDARVANADTIA